MELIYKEVFFRSHGKIPNWGLKRSRFSAALNGHFPTLLAVDGCRDIVIAIGNKLPRPCEIAHRRNLEEISHGQHC